MKYCKDCKFYHPVCLDMGGWSFDCNHPKSFYEREHKVLGKWKSKNTCSVMRKAECGEDGKLYKSASLLRKIIRKIMW